MDWESLTRLITRLSDDKDRLRSVLRKLFSDPENVLLYARLVFPHHVTSESPAFHRKLVAFFVSQPGNKAAAAPRGFAKSTTVNLILTSWLVVNERYHFILSASDTYGQSIEFVNTLKAELESNEWIRFIYGDLVGAQWGQGNFATSTGVKVMARATGMKVRGLKYRQYRPELIIGDDLENDESVSSPEQRKKLKRWMLRAVIPALAKGGECWVVGTMLHYDSLLMNMVTRKGEFASWKSALFKAIWTDAEGNERSLWPAAYSVDDLRRMRDDPTHPKYVGSITFAQEYQNEPRSDEDSIIRPEWIKWADSMPDRESIAYTVIAVDPAISKADTADFTAKVAAAVDKDDNVYVFGIGNDRHGFKESSDSIREWYNRIRPDQIGIEIVSFQEAFKVTLGDLPIKKLDPDRDKVRRLLAASATFEAGKFHIVRGIRNAEALYDQLIQFPFGQHDDLVDAAVYAIMMLKNPSKTFVRNLNA